MNELWLIRHAETEWAKAHRHTGLTDIPLTDDGRAAARALRDRLAGHDFSAVLVSPLSRARETAELAGLGEHAQMRDDLLEWDYGDYEGITTTEIREGRPGWYLWDDGVPHGETGDDVAARVDRVIAEALQLDGDVAIVAHGHVLRVLAARWLEQPAAFGGRLVLDTGTVSRLGFERDVRALLAWNT
ncbi:MAG TPA: histidine phosphatase family protein [Baekduia sp.]|uniref:histidine phosphatase family protein n=1 Tax=Baekduia sp. TaxID=2600305 RepID=UPI002D0FDB33|nr:histidine phosphatase family protein [Baekduia sp.]HMJ37050.1 histidine phosphatase family protein [Baekduia sp.]